MIHPVTVPSPRDPRLSARVQDTSRGVEVAFYRRTDPRYPPALIGRLGRQIVDAPFHVALDLAHDLLRDGAVR